MEATAIRQRMTLSDQLSVLQPTPNLRDLLKFRDDGAASAAVRRGTVTLAAVLEAEKNAAAASSSSTSSSGAGGGGRTLLDVIREEEGAGVRDPADRAGIRTWPAGSAPARASASGTIRVSLMTLMELREREDEDEDRARARGAAAEAEADVADDNDEDYCRGGRCCVCMARKKGAAFIPCGHTFCRVCSRELLMGRGNCPLCNATILEVLDIF